MRQFLKFLFASCLGTILAGIFLFFLTWIVAAGIMASQSKTPSIKPNTVLKIKFNDVVPELTNNTPVTSIKFEPDDVIGLQDIIKMINTAKEDKNIKGIYLNDGVINLDNAGFLTLRKTLEDFKSSGKFLIAHADYFTQKSYMLASIADQVSVHPFGGVDFRGYAAAIPFFTEAMENLGIKMEIFYAGQFKSATEPWRLKEMSPQNKLQVREYLNDLYSVYLDQISSARAISISQLKTIADEYQAHNAEAALDLNLIDKICSNSEVENDIREKLGLGAKDKVKYISLTRYKKAKGISTDFSIKDQIAVVYAEGEIVDNNDQEGLIEGNKYAKILNKLAEDDKTHAVVLRINSPGGSILASEEILNAVNKIRESGKPVVASYGGLAASGGYYISCTSDKIISEPNTITGSIGVFMMIPNVQELFNDKIGISIDTVITGKYAASFSPFLDWTEDEGKILQKETDRFYNIFLEHVAKGRDMSVDEVHKIAQGRVWSGIKAQKLGLVDEIGDLQLAIETAAELANLEKYRTRNYPLIKDPLTRLIEEFTSSDRSTSWMIKKQLGDLYPYVQAAEKLKSWKGPQARLPFDIQIK